MGDSLREAPKTADELAALEARYVPFADFRSWARVTVDEPRWTRYATVLSRRLTTAEETPR
jgi:hypothetical protein